MGKAIFAASEARQCKPFRIGWGVKQTNYKSNPCNVKSLWYIYDVIYSVFLCNNYADVWLGEKELISWTLFMSDSIVWWIDL